MCSMDNLRLAEKKARRNKSHQPGVKEFDKNPEGNLLLLHESLINNTYKTSEYSVFLIHEPKEREVFKLPYNPDRIAHHAAMLVLEKIFVSTFTSFTYACLKKRGIKGATFALREALKDKEATTYCLKLDIKKFYPNVNHDILKALLRKKIKDKEMLAFLDEIIDSAKGLPIGNYLSSYFANFYLTYFDHWLKEEMKVKNCFRYSDDIIILADNKPYLHELLFNIKQYLQTWLKLEVKGNHSIFPTSCGIRFVGYVHYNDYVLLRKPTKQHFARAVKSNNKKSIASLYGWAKYCNSKNLLKKLKMTRFSELGIKPPTNNMEGNKIEMYKVINK